MSDNLCFKTATEQARLIRVGELSAIELTEAHLRQIERVNPHVNAIVTLVADRALDDARAADTKRARGEPLGVLHGLPVAHKDLAETRGMRTTYGSPLFADFVPDFDALIVERLKQGGAITLGKTNTPEFGAGSQTFNAVFGATRNPYNTDYTCGGSSGGAAVALACGMVALADGSDMGGSLRNPANYCNVVGLRPSPGRVPMWPKGMGWATMSVQGPMARTVEDIALMLQAIAGPDPREPIAVREPGTVFARSLERNFANVRLAWSDDLGSFAVDERVMAVLQKARPVFEQLGCIVEETHPDFSDADEAFKALRAVSFESKFGELIDQHPNQFKETIIWNTEQGRKLTGPQLSRLEMKRTALYHRVREFMETYEFLLLPVSQVPPFSVKQEYVTEINGEPMDTYIDWMRSCYFISVTGLPALSVPCGFTDEGLPVGIQIVGRHQSEFALLQIGYAFQQATETWRKVPTLAKPE